MRPIAPDKPNIACALCRPQSPLIQPTTPRAVLGVKELINNPADVVADALRGLAAAHPELRVDHANRVVYRGDAPVVGKVGLISGGGSGRESLHACFVGPVILRYRLCN
jgi:hypothetical protein